ncbi:MAG: class I SAM-dependent methyltransferase [Alphaproteobacteria bacterium]|nr:class I SAM-dependent methyltransferase [Alphaproteobacteria bacterium]
MRSQRPSNWIGRFMHLVPAGADVLDLACGTGRHTALFSASGFKVTAVDRDISQLGVLAERKNIEVHQVDLEGETNWPFSNRSFGAIVVANYLHRPLIPHLISALEPGGVLIYETFAAGNEQFGKPSNPNFLLEPGELMDVVAGKLTVVAYEHGVLHHPRSAVVQRICAMNRSDPVVLQPR